MYINEYKLPFLCFIADSLLSMSPFMVKLLVCINWRYLVDDFSSSTHIPASCMTMFINKKHQHPHLIVNTIGDHNGNKCLHFFVSSFYLMYFVFISYVYMYNVLHFILNKSKFKHAQLKYIGHCLFN